MARSAKNEKKLTIEEKLEQALVPEAEQPYPVPENWCWTKVGILSSLHRGVSYRKGDAHSNKQPNDCLILRSGNIGEGFISIDEDSVYVDKASVSKDQVVRANDIIIVTSTGSEKVIGRAGIATLDYADVAFGAFLMLVRPKSSVNGRYVGYYFLSGLYRNRIRKMATGVNINNIRANYINESPLPLPPLAEQQRIVDRIERLFSKLDAAKEKAQAVMDGYEDRKAAILHKAFTGELTRSWAALQDISVDAWQTKCFNDVAEVKSNLVDPADHPDFAHIAPDNIEKKTGKLLDYHTVAEDAVKSGKHRFYAGQILYSKIRPNLSKVVVIDFDGLCSADMYPIEPKEGVGARFLWYYMLSDEFVLQASTAGSRSVLPKINQKELASLKIRITDIKEQERVVTVLDKYFEKEHQAKEAAEQVIDQIDTMKKSILARAFRGELGTNDPADMNALEVIRQAL